MRTATFVSIFLVIFMVYGAANFYIFIRAMQALPQISWVRFAFTSIFILFSVSYFLSKLLERTSFYGLHHVVYWIGSFWFAAILYFILSILVIDLIRLSNIWFHFLPDIDSQTYLNLKYGTLGFVFLLVSSVLSYGHWNATHPVIKNIDIILNKSKDNSNPLKLAMVSDIHLGTMLGKEKVRQMVNTINQQKPDIILLAGDILDEVHGPIFRNNIGEPLKDLKAPLGVYGILGNHEYIGGISQAVDYLKSLHIRVLSDSLLFIDHKFYLVGRDDKDRTRFKGKKRLPLTELLKDVNRDYPVLVMDHQPFHLEEAVESKVDLQLSGHTHHGQFWPFNFITQRVFEVSWGYKKIQDTNVYVSCGYGYWGPPVRIGNTPEIVIIQLAL